MSNTEVKILLSQLREKKDRALNILERFQEKLETFEEKYDMETEDFVEKFESGELDDREDFFEWISVYKEMKHWQKDRQK